MSDESLQWEENHQHRHQRQGGDPLPNGEQGLYGVFCLRVGNTLLPSRGGERGVHSCSFFHFSPHYALINGVLIFRIPCTGDWGSSTFLNPFF